MSGGGHNKFEQISGGGVKGIFFTIFIFSVASSDLIIFGWAGPVVGEVACLHLCFLYLFQMVRTYKKKGMRGLWTEQDMQHAVDAVRQGEPLKTVAREYRVPRNTLRRHAGRDAPAKVKKRPGRKTVLSEEEECELHYIILDMENALYGLTRSDLQDLVFQFCCKNQIPNPFTTTEKAGRDWLNGFLQRNPEISIRKPENVSIGRAYGFSRHKVADFFTKYLKVIYDENGNRIIPNSNIYNADESGFTIVHRPEKILGQKGKRAIGTLTSAEKGKTITFLPAVSAVGHYVPPLFVFPRKRMKLDLLENAPDGSIGAANPTGWINTEIFEEWFDHFLNVVQPKARPQPTLLIFDGQKAHTKNVSLIDKARDNKVVLISLPPHCTHKLQPLDRTFFKSLKNNYNHEVHLWMRDHRGMGLSQTKIPELIKLAYNKSANMENAANGFRVSGLVPPNEHIFCDEDYAASDNFIRQQALEAPNTPEDNDNANDVRLTTSNGPAMHLGPSSTGPSSTGASNVPANQPGPSSTGASNVPVNQPGPSRTCASNVPVNQPGPSSTGASNVPVNQPGPSSTGASNVPVNQPGPFSTGASNVPVNQPGPSSTGASNVPVNQPGPSSTGASNVPANQPGPSGTVPSSTGAITVGLPANQPDPSSTGASNVPVNQPDPPSTGGSNVPVDQPGPSSTVPSSTGASNEELPVNQPGPPSTGASNVPVNQPGPSSTVPFTVHEVTFRDILATMSPPHMGTKTKRKRKTERAEVITSSPYKRRLVAEHEERNKKELKKGVSQRRQKENVKCTATSKGKQRQRKKRVSPVRKQHSNMSKDTAKHRNGPRNHLVNFYCIYCNELFVDPPEFSWIQCSECKQWAHENETDYEGIGVFICDECR